MSDEEELDKETIGRKVQSEYFSPFLDQNSFCSQYGAKFGQCWHLRAGSREAPWRDSPGI